MNHKNFEYIEEEYKEILILNDEVSDLIQFANKDKQNVFNISEDHKKNDYFNKINDIMKSNLFSANGKSHINFDKPFHKLIQLINKNVYTNS